MCIRLYLCVRVCACVCACVCMCVCVLKCTRLSACKYVSVCAVYLCVSFAAEFLLAVKHFVYRNCCKTAECRSQQRKMSHSTPHVTNYHNPTLILFYKKAVYKQLGLGRSKCLETVGLGYIASTLRNSEVVILRNFIFKQTNMSNKYYQ